MAQNFGKELSKGPLKLLCKKIAPVSYLHRHFPLVTKILDHTYPSHFFPSCCWYFPLFFRERVISLHLTSVCTVIIQPLLCFQMSVSEVNTRDCMNLPASPGFQRTQTEASFIFLFWSAAVSTSSVSSRADKPSLGNWDPSLSWAKGKYFPSSASPHSN